VDIIRVARDILDITFGKKLFLLEGSKRVSEM